MATAIVACRFPLRPFVKAHARHQVRRRLAPPAPRPTSQDLGDFLRGDTSVLPALLRGLDTTTLDAPDAAALLWEIVSVPTPEFLEANEHEVRDVLRAIVRGVRHG